MILKFSFKNIRISKNISQEELANRCNLSQSYISELENNSSKRKSPTLNTVANIATQLNVCPKDLLICDCEKCRKEKSDKQTVI